MAALKKVLIALGVLAALFVCLGSAVALWGLSGFRGEVCSHLGELPGIVEHTGRLTHCDQRKDVTTEPSTSVFDVAGERGHGRVFVKSQSDAHGNVTFLSVRFVVDGQELKVE